MGNDIILLFILKDKLYTFYNSLLGEERCIVTIGI